MRDLTTLKGSEWADEWNAQIQRIMGTQTKRFVEKAARTAGEWFPMAEIANVRTAGVVHRRGDVYTLHLWLTGGKEWTRHPFPVDVTDQFKVSA